MMSDSHSKKAQSAMEYLMTYGWAILIIAVALAILYQLGIFGGSSALVGTSCLAATGYLCGAPQLNTTGNLIVQFGQVGQTITLTGIACTGNAVPPSSLQNVAQTQLATGQTIPLVFNCPLNSNVIGSKFTGYLWVQYNSQAQNGNIGKVGAITAVASTAHPVSATTTTSTTTTIIYQLDGAVDSGIRTNANSYIVTLSTTSANDLIYVFVDTSPNNFGVSSISDTAGLSWSGRGISGHSINVPAGVYTAIANAPLTNDQITIGVSSFPLIEIGAFAINGIDPSSPFDLGSMVWNHGNSGTDVSMTLSTSNANDGIIYYMDANGCNNACTTFAAPPGFTYILGGGSNYMYLAYESVNQAFSGNTISSTGTSTDGWVAALDAVK